jgi:hypothetical protein
VSAPATPPKTTELAPAQQQVAYGQRGVQLANMGELFRFAQAVVQSGMVPRGVDTPQKVMVAIQAGAELGMGPMQALQSYAVIGNRPALMVEPALALVMASGLLEQRSVRFDGEGPTRSCTVQLVRRGGLATEWTYSIEDAKRAGLLSKDTWRQHQDRMLYNRSMGYCLHDIFPDILRGRALVGVDDFEEPARREPVNVTPRVAREPEGPDPLLAQLEPGAPVSQPPALEPEVVPPEASPIEETDDADSATA